MFAPEPGNGVGDPVDVARGRDRARRAKMYDVVVVDTAGRLGIDAELMQQAADIRDAVQPDETLFVVDAMIGQDAVTTAQAFLDGVGFDGVVLTKLDGDARGGAALSVAKVTGRQVMFASAGEKLDDFDAFHPDRMASRILGMGDVLTLIEQAEKAFDKDQAEEMAGKFGRGEDFTFEDFLAQMESVRKMGSMSKLLGMLPGHGRDARADREHRRARGRPHHGDHQVDDAGGAPQPQDPQRLAPPAHRPRLRPHRRRRQRAGRAVHRGAEDDEAAGGRRRHAGDAGDAGDAGMGRGKKAKGKARPKRKAKGGRSGNPAKRALEQRQWEARAGRGAGARPDLPEDFELP